MVFVSGEKLQSCCCCIFVGVVIAVVVVVTLTVVVLLLSFLNVVLLWLVSDCGCVVLLQPAGEGGAGDVEGDGDLLRYLSDQADGATAGLPVGGTHSAPCCWWWVALTAPPAGPLDEPKPNLHHSVNTTKKATQQCVEKQNQ